MNSLTLDCDRNVAVASPLSTCPMTCLIEKEETLSHSPSALSPSIVLFFPRDGHANYTTPSQHSLRDTCMSATQMKNI